MGIRGSRGRIGSALGGVLVVAACSGTSSPATVPTSPSPTATASPSTTPCGGHVLHGLAVTGTSAGSLDGATCDEDARGLVVLAEESTLAMLDSDCEVVEQRGGPDDG